MQILIKSVTNTFAINVNQSDRIETIKSQLHTHEPYILIYKCEHLEDSKTLNDYGIVQYDTLLLVKLHLNSVHLSHSEAMTSKTDQLPHIKVTNIAGKTISINLDPLITIELIKQKICHMEGIPINQQMLIFAGKQLENQYLATTYGIKSGDRLHLVLRMADSS